jgi:photosystem II stability/assembly factor-like uncharacterized protein
MVLSKRLMIIGLLFISYFSTFCQQVQILTHGIKSSLRGLSVINKNSFWASGSNGKVARSIDGGKTIKWITVEGYEKRDFRDIEAFNESTALIMAVSEPAIILKTTDSGFSWKKVFEDTTKGMFLDAMDFEGKNGICIGDPLNNKPYTITTKDYGNTWQKVNDDELPVLQKGEAFFASSGTNIKLMKNGVDYIFVSGGLVSSIYQSGSKVIQQLDLQKGKESTGANSIAWYKNNGVIVGGDFARDSITLNNCLLYSIKKGVMSFTPPIKNPSGYKSAVTYITKNTLLACGTSGLDISVTGGKEWVNFSKDGFHAIQRIPNSKAAYAVGSTGKVALIQLQ